MLLLHWDVSDCEASEGMSVVATLYLTLNRPTSGSGVSRVRRFKFLLQRKAILKLFGGAVVIMLEASVEGE